MKKLCLILLISIIAIMSVLPASQGVAFADTKSGSNVLDDLRLDESFNKENYPINNSDYGLYVFQIAESTDGELLIYVYQPCVNKDFRAISLNLSTTINDDISYVNYTLTYLNSEETLYKYKVNDFSVSSDKVRYYSITQIMRAYDSAIDNPNDYDNTTSEVPCSVRKQWKFFELNGKPCADCLDIETITVTSKYVGFVRYSNGEIFQSFAYPSHTDCHFVAFSTDRKIEELYEADVQWSYQSWKYLLIDGADDERFDETLGTLYTSDVTTLYADEVVSSGSSLIFADRFSFNRIQSVSDLLSEEDKIQVLYDGAFVKINGNTAFSQSAKTALKNKQWVLRFKETPYTTSSGQAEGTEWITATKVSDVIILRLKFKTNGVVYNLGVIDNKQTGSDTPSGETKVSVELSEEFKDFLKILLIIVGIVVLCVLLPYVLKFVGFILKIIFAPFKWIFGRSSARNGSAKYKKRK